MLVESVHCTGSRETHVFPSLYTDRSWPSFVENGGRLTETGTQDLTGLAFTGSDQAHEGRLVDALAIRGDEGRGTLR